MNNNTVRRLSTEETIETVDEQPVPVDELNQIVNTFEELIDWLQDHLSSVKEILKGQADKFKKKILKLKNLNGSGIPVRHQ